MRNATFLLFAIVVACEAPRDRGPSAMGEALPDSAYAVYDAFMPILDSTAIEASGLRRALVLNRQTLRFGGRENSPPLGTPTSETLLDSAWAAKWISAKAIAAECLGSQANPCADPGKMYVLLARPEFVRVDSAVVQLQFGTSMFVAGYRFTLRRERGKWTLLARELEVIS